MKKTDYEAIAQAIKETSEYSNAGYFVIAKNDFIRKLCDILAADNKNFNKEKFMEACK